MSNQLQLAGAQTGKPARFAPIFTNRFFQGLWTQRNPMRDAGSTRIEEKFYGTRGDAMIAGSNVEISNRLTPIRRPGNSVYNSQNFSSVDFFYEFRLFSANSEQIRVMVDTAATLYDGTGPSGQTLVWNKLTGAGQTFMQYVANVLYFGDGVSQKKWVQTLTTWTANTVYPINGLQTFLIDTNGHIEQLIATAITNITNVAVAANVLTLTVVSSTNIAVGSQYPIWGVTNAIFLNGQTITVVSSGAGTVTAVFPHGIYASTPDTGALAMLQGGLPVSGNTQPGWTAGMNAPQNATIDNTAIWVNRGLPVENWGIAAPTTAPTVNVGVTNSGWQTNTFYANDFVVIDSNGNLQKTTTPGKTGSIAPSWATFDGGTTNDGTVIWTQLETAAELTWAANTVYGSSKPFIAANAGGARCLFKVQPATLPVFKQVSGQYVTAWFYTHTHSFAGQCELRNPVDGGNNPGGGGYPLLAFGSGTSVLYNPPQLTGHPDPNLQPISQATINGAGNISGYTTPWGAGAFQNYNMIVTFTLTFTTAGNYTFAINHDDGMYWGIGPSAGNQPSIISGPNICPAPAATLTALNSYKVMGANNTSGNFTDTYTVNIPAAGDYPFEIDYCQWENAQNLCFYCQGQTPVPGAATSGTITPVWPTWTTSFAPAYPHVSEINNSAPSGGNGPGPMVWNNLGPVADYAWHASTQFTQLATIIDPVNNTEDAYEAGVTGTSQPTFATGPNQLTKDNPNLTWINQGPGIAPPPGTLSTFLGGWSYAISLVNSVTNTVSNAGLITTKTGNFIGAQGVTLTGGVPTQLVIDPQVDYVAIFRTQDGGANWYLIPGTGNCLYTIPLAQYVLNGFLDTTPDANLNILIQAPLASQNTPPPSGFINLTYHLNRVFGSVGNTVYWSSGPTTPVGNGAEGFPPLNTAVFPSLVKRIVPTSIGALVFTVSDIYLIGGQGTSSSPLFPQPFATGIGLLSYNALAVNGTTIYLFTADSQLVSLDPSSGLSQVGFPIGDQFTLSNWNPSNAYVTWHVSGSQDHALYVSDGSSGWFRMTPTAAPESGLTWSPFASIVGGCKAVQSIETAPGVHKLLLGPTGAGNILNRDLTTQQDNGSSYNASFTIGSIVLAQPGQIAELSFVTTDAMAVGTQPRIAVLLDEISGQFQNLPRFTNDPPQLVPPSSLYSQRFYFSQSQQPAMCRHLQLQVNWPPENAANELLSMTMFGAYQQED